MNRMNRWHAYDDLLCDTYSGVCWGRSQRTKGMLFTSVAGIVAYHCIAWNEL